MGSSLLALGRAIISPWSASGIGVPDRLIPGYEIPAAASGARGRDGTVQA